VRKRDIRPWLGKKAEMHLLDGNLPFELAVGTPRQIDPAHPTGTKQADQNVLTDPAARSITITNGAMGSFLNGFLSLSFGTRPRADVKNLGRVSLREMGRT
jgi:hypothetical protein